MKGGRLFKGGAQITETKLWCPGADVVGPQSPAGETARTDNAVHCLAHGEGWSPVMRRVKTAIIKVRKVTHKVRPPSILPSSCDSSRVIIEKKQKTFLHLRMREVSALKRF
jgi:hypothetical protein